MDDITHPRTETPNDTGSAVVITVRYWAGAADAAGVTEERLTLESEGPTAGALRHQIVLAHPGIEAVLQRCSILRAGQRCDDDVPLAGGDELEVLPPFAGG